MTALGWANAWLRKLICVFHQLQIKHSVSYSCQTYAPSPKHKIKMPASQIMWELSGSPFHRVFRFLILEAACSQKVLWSRNQRLWHLPECSWWNLWERKVGCDAVCRQTASEPKDPPQVFCDVTISRPQPNEANPARRHKFFPKPCKPWLLLG